MLDLKAIQVVNPRGDSRLNINSDYYQKTGGWQARYSTTVLAVLKILGFTRAWQQLSRQIRTLRCSSTPGLRFTQGLTTFTNLYGIFYTPFTPFYAFLRLFTNHFLQNNNTNQRLY